MKAKIVAAITLVGGLATTACDSIGQAMTAHTDVVARAAGHELKVDRTASLLAANPRIPAQPDVVTAVANLWVDYMLLATAAGKDSTLKNVNLDALLQPIMDQEAVVKLRDLVIKVDTVLSEDELRKMFDATGTGLQVRARHILLRLPPDASPAARDSVTKLATSLRDQARGGADFADLARRFSADGSAQGGGDLGWTGKGGWVAPFEEAAFKLQPGQVSDVVETPFGLHVIKMEERKSADYAEHAATFRQTAVDTKKQEAEEAYVKGLTEPLKIEIQPGAYEVVKDLASKPEAELKGRSGSRALIKYQGGTLSARDYVEFLRTRLTAQNRAVIPQRSDEELKGLLESMARSKILVEEAGRKKLAMTPAKIDSLRNEARGQLVEAVRGTGLLGLKAQEGESKDQAIERKVLEMLEATIKGEMNVIPLGALSYSLREQFGGEIFEKTIPAVVAKVEATRPPGQGMPPGMMPPDAGGPPPPPPTTTGN